jgi:hypothetical protein
MRITIYGRPPLRAAAVDCLSGLVRAMFLRVADPRSGGVKASQTESRLIKANQGCMKAKNRGQGGVKPGQTSFRSQVGGLMDGWRSNALVAKYVLRLVPQGGTQPPSVGKSKPVKPGQTSFRSQMGELVDGWRSNALVAKYVLRLGSATAAVRRKVKASQTGSNQFCGPRQIEILFVSGDFRRFPEIF